MKKIIFLSLVFVNLAFGKCFYEFNTTSFDMSWTAYKTLLKKPVSGSFEDMTFANFSAPSIEKLLLSASVSIFGDSVDAKNVLKSSNIQTYFFGNLTTKLISADIVGVNGDILDVNISLNGINKKIPMSYEFKEDTISAKGVIDLNDFASSSALGILTKSVPAHLGKSWSDIDLEFSVNILKDCR